jgi:opacity protein-like surface antigen
MLRKLTFGIVLAVLLAAPALAQEGEAAEEAKSPLGWGLYAGYLMGDVISEASFGDEGQFQAELDDDAIFGGLFWAEMNENWRFETRLTYMPATILNVAPFDWFGPEPDGPARTVSADIFYLDVGFIRFFDLGESVRLGIPFGVGWASSYTDEVFSDFIPGRSIGLQQEDGSGGTYYLGFQLLFEVSDRWELFVDSRFKRFHRLTNVLERTAKTNEFTVGFSRRF